jgi:hypothetical protein
LEAGTGRSLQSTDHRASYGKAMVLPLQIRLSGDYRVRLMAGGTQLDAFQFSVVRTDDSGAILNVNTNSGTVYAKGMMGIGMQSAHSSDLFDDYDAYLNQLLMAAMKKEASLLNNNVFAQRAPGKVVLQCRLDFQGRISEPRLIENTIDEGVGRLFQQALLKRSPYPVWPEEAHRKLGSDYRPLKLTFRLE